MSGCSNKGRDALMPTLRIEVDLSDGRTLHRDLALNGCEVVEVRVTKKPRGSCDERAEEA